MIITVTAKCIYNNKIDLHQKIQKPYIKNDSFDKNKIIQKYNIK